MRTIRNLTTKVSLLIILITSLVANKTYAQCSEFSIADYEKICNLNYDELNNFISEKKFEIINDSKNSVFITCNLSKKNGLLVDVGESVSIHEVSNIYGNKLLGQLKTKAYKFSFTSKGDSGETVSFYSNNLYNISIVKYLDKTFHFTISVKKTRDSNSNKNQIENEEKVIAKKISLNSYEITSFSNTTDIKIKKSDKIFISASGNVTYGPWAGSGGPEGIDGYTSYNRIQGFKHGSLLVRIGENGVWEEVGKSKTIVAGNAGILQFLVNDADPSNNNGSFIVEYSINKPLVSTIQNQPNTSIKQNSQSNNSYPKVETSYDLKSNLPRKFNGNIVNTSINIKSSCIMTIYDNNNNSYRLIGNADNVNLIGRWDLIGYEIIKENKKMYHFSGYIDFGYDGTGFPKGTKADFKVVVEITQAGMIGTYEIGTFKYSANKQYGTINLN